MTLLKVIIDVTNKNLTEKIMGYIQVALLTR